MATFRLKKGSVLTFALPSGWVAASRSPAVVSVSGSPPVWTVTANSPGQTWIDFTIRPDLVLSVEVQVTP